MNFKYLIIEHEGMPVPILFSTLIKHSDLRAMLGPGIHIISAGHAKIAPAGQEPHIEVCGKAGSLDMVHRPEDQAIIAEDYCRLRGLATESF